MTVTEGRIEDASAKAATLIEALPWLNRFHGQTVVIKYGGAAMEDPDLREAFAAAREKQLAAIAAIDAALRNAGRR